VNDPSVTNPQPANRYRLRADCVDVAPCGHAVCDALRDHDVTVHIVQESTRTVTVDGEAIGGIARHEHTAAGPSTWTARLLDGTGIAPDRATKGDALDDLLARHFNPPN
jgi:hypothetical protein